VIAAAASARSRIAFQGEPGANSDAACREVAPELEPLPCPTFEDTFAAVTSGAAALAIGDAVKGVHVAKDDEDADVSILVRGHEDHFTFSVDASGERLHRRGARIEIGAAPLRETLAAGRRVLLVVSRLASALACDECGEIHYQNPKLVLGTIPEHGERILLCRRAIEPRYGYDETSAWVEGVSRLETTIHGLVGLATRRGLIDDPIVRRKLAELSERAASLRSLGYKGFSSFAQGSSAPEHSPRSSAWTGFRLPSGPLASSGP